MQSPNYNMESVVVPVPVSTVKGARPSFNAVVSGIPNEYLNHFVSIGCYHDIECSEWARLHTPSAAVVTVTDDGKQWGKITNGTVDLSATDYPRPNWCGRVAAVKAVFGKSLTVESDDGKTYYMKVSVHSYK